jgi:hypothetical protein
MAERKKLKISCGSVDCENGLHCYKLTKREAGRAWRFRSQLSIADRGTSGSTGLAGTFSGCEIPLDARGRPVAGPAKVCKACGANLVDWDRVHKQSIRDVEYTFNALKTECIRHHFWHRPLDESTKAYAYKRGKIELRLCVRRRIHSSIGRAAAAELWRDGAQTPLEKKRYAQYIIYCAQHATASCCRKCAEEWHKIPLNRAMTEVEEAYLTELAMRYIQERVEGLSDEGIPKSAAKMAKGKGDTSLPKQSSPASKSGTVMEDSVPSSLGEDGAIGNARVKRPGRRRRPVTHESS